MAQRLALLEALERLVRLEVAGVRVLRELVRVSRRQQHIFGAMVTFLFHEVAQAARQLRFVLLVFVTLLPPEVATLAIDGLFTVAEESGVDRAERLASSLVRPS